MSASLLLRLPRGVARVRSPLPWRVFSTLLVLPLILLVTCGQRARAQGAATGRLSGAVVDKETARPVPNVQVSIVGTAVVAVTDLDGRYRTAPVPAGRYTVRMVRLGFRPLVFDSVQVREGQSTTLDAAISTAAVTLGATVVEAERLRGASSEEAMLALQKNAPRVSDGISAQAISRAPGSDAADAITRVTGVTVTDDKFVVVRGLSERYSNTLLNGVELSSPEPLKKIVPLDMFPSSLLESIVTNKTATPDRPGDFAGGSVEITTKEFPENRVAEVSFSSGYNSESTLRPLSTMPQRGLDFLGFDSGRRRQMPVNPPTQDDSPESERFAEAMRDVWTPTPRRVQPDLGVGLNLGGRVGSDRLPFGYAIAGTYSHKNDYAPHRLSQLVFDPDSGVADRGYVASEATTTTDLGAIANFATRIGNSQKIGWKNLYTRNAEELLSQSTGFETYNGSVERRIYQVRYVTRDMLQTQLTGDHLIAPLFGSRFEWKGTMSRSARDEPENRSLIYFKNPVTGVFRQGFSTPSPIWFRFLDDKLMSAQADLSVPFSLHRSQDGQFKTGASIRQRDRDFDASLYYIGVKQALGDPEQASLDPELAMAPENIGSVFGFKKIGTYALPYASDDDVRAAYGMLDLPLLSWLRLVGGMRIEEWKLNLFQGSREAPIHEPTRRQETDYLWSGNLTVSLTDRQNLRFAGYRTVARPDPREASPDYYVAVTGDCGNRGNPDVNRTRILNGDVRWEWYPNPGEIFSLSGFYKDFRDPIVEIIQVAGSGSCDVVYTNVERAQNYGGEVEARKNLDFLPGALRRLSAGANFTLVHSRADFAPPGVDTLLHLPMPGQSEYVVNGNLMYTDGDRVQASVLVNAFGDRVLRYGTVILINGVARQVPHVVEKGRVTVDAKIQRRLSRGLTVSLSGRNLTNSAVTAFQESLAGRVQTAFVQPGISATLGVGYALR